MKYNDRLEDILYMIYMKYKINKGLNDIKNNNVKTTEEVKDLIDKW